VQPEPSRRLSRLSIPTHPSSAHLVQGFFAAPLVESPTTMPGEHLSADSRQADECSGMAGCDALLFDRVLDRVFATIERGAERQR